MLHYTLILETIDLPSVQQYISKTLHPTVLVFIRSWRAPVLTENAMKFSK